MTDTTKRRPSMGVAPEFVDQIEADLRHLIAPEHADEMAKYIAAEIEIVGGSDARLVFLADDGTGPWCSWCWALAGMCPHIAGGESEHVTTTP